LRLLLLKTIKIKLIEQAIEANEKQNKPFVTIQEAWVDEENVPAKMGK